MLRFYIRSAFFSGLSLILNASFSYFPRSGPSFVPWLSRWGPSLPSRFLPIFLPASPTCFKNKNLHLSLILHGWVPICHCQHALVLCSAHLPGSHLLFTSGPPICQPPAYLNLYLLPVAKVPGWQVLPPFWTSQLLGCPPKDRLFSRSGPLPLYVVPAPDMYQRAFHFLSGCTAHFLLLWSMPSEIYGSN